MPTFDLSDLQNVGPEALVVLFVLLLFFGQLVRPGELRRERDYWRAAFFEEQSQKRELMVTGQVQRDFLRALPPPADDEDEPPGTGG